jgi:hypothetical protein
MGRAIVVRTDCTSGDVRRVAAELKEFAVNAWCAPERICDTHVADEFSGLMWRPWPATVRS